MSEEGKIEGLWFLKPTPCGSMVALLKHGESVVGIVDSEGWTAYSPDGVLLKRVNVGRDGKSFQDRLSDCESVLRSNGIPFNKVGAVEAQSTAFQAIRNMLFTAKLVEPFAEGDEVKEAVAKLVTEHALGDDRGEALPPVKGLDPDVLTARLNALVLYREEQLEAHLKWLAANEETEDSMALVLRTKVGEAIGIRDSILRWVKSLS